MLPSSFSRVFSFFAQGTVKFLFCLTALLSFASQNLEGVYNVVYNTTDNGGMAFTGNTLGFKKKDAWVQSARTFNYSSAVLDLPTGSTVLHAELIWSGCYEDSRTGVSVPSVANNSLANQSLLNLKDAAGIVHEIQANPSTAQESHDHNDPANPREGNYVRSADVTKIIAAAGSGTYTVGYITDTVDSKANSMNETGWTLAVVYRHPAMYTNNMTIWCGCEQASQTSNLPAQMNGFNTPSIGELSARLFISAVEGDANITGDSMLFGSTASLVSPENAIFGSNNSQNNFFSSQLNTLLKLAPDQNGKLVVTPSRQSGQLDQRGTFGSPHASRQGMDITSIDVSSLISHSQTEAFALGATTGDDFTITALGFQIQVDAPAIKAEKFVNGVKSIRGKIGDTHSFTMKLENKGTTAAKHVFIHENIQAGLNFIPGSVTINGLPDSSADPCSINLPDLAVNESISVSFNAILEVPENLGSSYLSFATINYDFTPSNQSQPLNLETKTDTIKINLPQNGPLISAPQKSVSPSQTTLGGIVTFTYTLQNIGDTDAKSVMIANRPLSNLKYLDRTVTINQKNYPDLDPSNILVGDLNVNDPVTIVTFDVMVNEPSPYLTYLNSGIISYHYKKLNGTDIQDYFESNQTAFSVGSASAQLQTSLMADTQTVSLGETITYTLLVKNTGNEIATHVVLKNILPIGLSFKTGSVKISGHLFELFDPTSGFPLPNLSKNETVSVVFRATADNFPSALSQYINQGMVSYSKIFSDAKKTTYSINTNELKIKLFQQEAFLVATKTVDPTHAALHDVVTFEFTLDNTGGSTATSITFKDILPAGLTYVEDSFVYNGNPFAIADPSSVDLPDLGPQGSATFSFQATVAEFPETGCTYENSASLDYQSSDFTGLIPQDTVNTNTVILNIEKSDASITATKLVDDTEEADAHLGDILTFTFSLENTGDLPANNVLFKDILPSGLSFLPGTFTLDGTTVSPNPNLNLGFLVGTIAPHQTVEIEFHVLFNAFPDTGDTYENLATVNYQFTRCDGSIIENSTETNAVTIHLLGDPLIEATKFVNALEEVDVVIGQIVTFTFSLENIGDAPASSVIFEDTLDQGLLFVPGTFKINGNLVLPEPDIHNGISIGTIKPGQRIFIEFKAQVVAFPAKGLDYFNFATIDYQSPSLEDETAETNDVDLHLLPPAPSHFHGYFQKCEYLNNNQYRLISKWKPANWPDVLFYRIFLNTVVIGEVEHSDELHFKYCVGDDKDVGVFTIVAVYAGNLQSAPIKLRIKHE